MGEYREKLRTDGELIVTELDWCISYYFSGRDLRYKGTWLHILPDDIDKYISAWKNNFSKYLKLKSELSDGPYEEIGEAGMKISIGGRLDGVCIDEMHMNIKMQEYVDYIIRKYTSAQARAPKIQKMLREIRQL